MFIQLSGVTKTYGREDNAVRALSGVTFGIEKGEYVAVVGPSGSGKSTLLNILAGLLHPSSGSVVIDSVDLYGTLDDDGLARFRSGYLGFVFQSFQLMPYLSALENCLLPLAPLPMTRKAKRDMALAALDRVGLANRSAHLPSELSGGQQQRVAIARALVNKPLILFADEPTGNLDRKTRDEILGLFAGLSLEGNTILMVTHDPGSIAAVNRVLTLEDGLVAGDSAAGDHAETPGGIARDAPRIEAAGQ